MWTTKINSGIDRTAIKIAQLATSISVLCKGVENERDLFIDNSRLITIPVFVRGHDDADDEIIMAERRRNAQSE